MLILSTPAPAADSIAPTLNYVQRDWHVVESIDCASLVTDKHVGAIEIGGDLGREVHEHLRKNGILGPAIHIPGPKFREIHLVAGLARANKALKWLTAIGVVVHRDGATVTLPATGSSAASPHWVGTPGGTLPPALAIAAAVRAVRARTKSSTSSPQSAAS